MSQRSGKFFRYRDLPARGRNYRVTLAVHRTNSGEESIYDVAFSFCAPNDIPTFNKKFGRRIAEGRLEKGVSVRITAAEVANFKGVFNAAMAEVGLFDERPVWFPQVFWNTQG